MENMNYVVTGQFWIDNSEAVEDRKRHMVCGWLLWRKDPKIRWSLWLPILEKGLALFTISPHSLHIKQIRSINYFSKVLGGDFGSFHGIFFSFSLRKIVGARGNYALSLPRQFKWVDSNQTSHARKWRKVKNPNGGSGGGTPRLRTPSPFWILIPTLN